MNPSQYTSVGSGTALLAQFIMWASKWPLQAPTEAQADAMAALLLLLVGSIHAWRIAAAKTVPSVIPEAPPHA